MIPDQDIQSAEASIGTPALPGPLDRYENMQVCWQTKDSIIFQGCVKGQQQRVLLKVSNPSARELSNEAEVRRDYRIAEVLRSIFAAKVFAIETTNNGPVIVYLDDGARPLAMLTPRSAASADMLPIAVALATALDDLHKEGLVHTNLNLDNVWLCPETGAIRISDFALSRYPAIDTPPLPPRLPPDPRFVAPEQTGRIPQPVDQRTDIYAFGIILFYLLTGRAPFEGTDTISILDRQLTAPVVFPAELERRIPSVLIQLVLKCLEKNSDERYAGASGLRADLLECLSQFQSTGTIRPFSLGGHDPSTTFRIPKFLYGREAETTILWRFVRNRERRPAVMLVTGSPGVGKTAFVNQLAEIVFKEHGRFITGKFDQYRRNVPYFSLAQAFQDLVHQLLAEPRNGLLPTGNDCLLPARAMLD